MLNNQKKLPGFIQIETTVFCNASCPFCPQKEMDRGTPDKTMADWIWKKIVDETRGQGIVYRPFVINEPFIDRRMPDIARYIKQDPTAKIEINTNGELLTEEKSKAILDTGIDIIRFSIDGHSQKTYDKTRPGINFEKTKKNVVRFLELAREKNTSCETYVRCIDMPETKPEQESFLRFWSPLADHVIITPLYRWPWMGQTDSLLKPCLKVLDEMFFLTDGRAVLCCWDFDARAVVGDAKTQTVEEIWQGETNRRYRSTLEKGRRDKIQLCSRCDAYKDHVFPGFDGAPAEIELDLTDALI